MFLWLEYELNQLGQFEYSVLLFMVSVVSIITVYTGLQSYRRYRVISGTATSKIRSAPQGYVELKGLGEWMPGDSIHSPFSGRRCLWYQCQIDRRERTGKNRTRWNNISNQVSDQIFHLVDETGKCAIDPESAHVEPEINNQWYGSNQDCKHTPDSGFSFGQNNYRFTEKIITLATEIYVIGHFQTKHHVPEETFIESEVTALIREWKLNPARYLSQYIDEAGGEIQDEVWGAINQAARRQILSHISEQNQPLHLISKLPYDNRPYIVSATTEDKLLWEKKWMAIYALLFGFISIGVLLVCLSSRPIF